MGERNAGADNDSYFDRIECKIMTDEGCASYNSPGGESRLYVDKDSPANPDGSSWTTAYRTLANALTEYTSDSLLNEIWIAEGTYTPTLDSNRDATFSLTRGAKVYGGFMGIETALDQRDIASNPTILSGDIGVQSDSTDNSYHIVTVVGNPDTILIDGVQINRGNAHGASTNAGAGLFADGTNTGVLQLSNIEFRNNSAGEGAATFISCTTLINESLFVSNAASIRANSILNDSSTLTLENVDFIVPCSTCGVEVLNLNGGQLLNLGTVRVIKP